MRRTKVIRRLVIGTVAAVIVAVVAYAGTTSRIDSYAACVDAGFPVLDTNPPVCRDGLHNFTGTPVPTPTPAAAVSAVDFEILVNADTRGTAPPHAQTLINSQAEWQAYWRQAHAGLATLPPLIPVDFATSSVVAASLGSRPSGGYGLKITNITTGPAGTTVSLTETTPVAGCVTTQSITNPYVIVRAPKLSEPANFRVTPQVHSCK